MNREIKFRVWSGNMFLDYGDANIYSPTPDDTEFEIKSGSPHKKYILQQFTGLKDKNGKEIYEGDIVKGTTYRYGYDLKDKGGKQFDYLGQVVWQDGENIGYYVEDFAENPGAWDIRDCVHRNDIDFLTGEIIGNIYENPELLTNK